jgi:hypothetical protein
VIRAILLALLLAACAPEVAVRQAWVPVSMWLP